MQHDYEVVRPIVLFSQPVAERSRETEAPRTTVSDKAKRFVTEGMLDLVDKRTRPANHPDNQLTLPFIEEVMRAQLEYPDAGRFRIHGILEQTMGDENPSERTVGRAMAHKRFWRDAPDPLNPEANQAPQETAELAYQHYDCHQYWFIDIRYLVKFEGK